MGDEGSLARCKMNSSDDSDWERLHPSPNGMEEVTKCIECEESQGSSTASIKSCTIFEIEYLRLVGKCSTGPGVSFISAHC